VLDLEHPGDLAVAVLNGAKAIASADSFHEEITHDERPQFYPFGLECLDLENEIMIVLILWRIGMIIVDFQFWWSIGVLVHLAHGPRLSVDG
jgi:hypothetical protein